jgi:hypothetical protein
MMMRVLVALLLGTACAAPVSAAAQDRLATLLQGRVAGSPRRCIFPDRAVQPQIINGTAIIYRDARYAYVGRFKGGCPALHEGRTVIVTGAGGQLCENDPARVVEATGADFGFCTFDKFTPYKKAK